MIIKNNMKEIFKIPIVAILLIPSLILTGLIWICGGWTREFDYMPNPIYKLLDWLFN